MQLPVWKRESRFRFLVCDHRRPRALVICGNAIGSPANAIWKPLATNTPGRHTTAEDAQGVRRCPRLPKTKHAFRRIFPSPHADSYHPCPAQSSRDSTNYTRPGISAAKLIAICQRKWRDCNCKPKPFTYERSITCNFWEDRRARNSEPEALLECPSRRTRTGR
jgi:hypothetical protein